MLTCYHDYHCVPCQLLWANKVSWIGQIRCRPLLITSTGMQSLKPTATAHLHEAFSTSLTRVSHACVGNVWLRLSLAQTGFGFPTSLHQSGLSLQTTEALSLIGKSAVSGESYLGVFGKRNVPVTLLLVITSNLNNVQNPYPKDSF